jgi:acyl carrier protein
MENRALELAKHVVGRYFESFPVDKKTLKMAVDVLDENNIDIIKEYKAERKNLKKTFPEIYEILKGLQSKNKVNKTIHFYKDASSAGCMMLDKVLTTHNATTQAIKIGDDDIHTFAISALDFASLLDKGYDIYLHENHKSFQIKEGRVEATDKEIRKAHNIRTIWIGGGFDNFFYKSKNGDDDLTLYPRYMELFNEIVNIIADKCCRPKDKIQFSTVINDMEFDALDLIELTMELEHHYNITIDEVEFDNLFVVADIVQLVYNKTK